MMIIEYRAPKSAVTGEYGKWEMANRSVYTTAEAAEREIRRMQKIFHAMEYRLSSLTVVSE